MCLDVARVLKVRHATLQTRAHDEYATNARTLYSLADVPAVWRVQSAAPRATYTHLRACVCVCVRARECTCLCTCLCVCVCECARAQMHGVAWRGVAWRGVAWRGTCLRMRMRMHACVQAGCAVAFVDRVVPRRWPQACSCRCAPVTYACTHARTHAKHAHKFACSRTHAIPTTSKPCSSTRHNVTRRDACDVTRSSRTHARTHAKRACHATPRHARTHAGTQARTHERAHTVEVVGVLVAGWCERAGAWCWCGGLVRAWVEGGSFDTRVKLRGRV